DHSDIEGGANWQTQIYDAIRRCDKLILCLSPDAVISPYVQDEWRYARREGTQVIPIVVSDIDYTQTPHWMKKLHWYDFRPKSGSETDLKEAEVQWRAFISQLNS
ncbi:MAG TPA: toll/interleukin-1 receptor domain-containing protein, partial [Aggregatilineales bacterium]|nr:toll/interleukin-1 receptor domain-containing protein [Aggregatilineales bacterium]